MNLLLRLLFLLIFAGAVRAQPGPDTLWTRTYPWIDQGPLYAGQFGANDITAADDGYLICVPIPDGLPDGRNDERYYFKINARGDTLWSQHCSGLDPEAYPRCIECGYGEARKSFHMLNKWNGPSTDPVNTPSHPRMQHIVRAADGGWILCGTSRPSYDRPGVFTCSYVTKLDSGGNELWMHKIGCEKDQRTDSTIKKREMQKPERRARIGNTNTVKAAKRAAPPASDWPGTRQFYVVTEMGELRATPDGGCLASGVTSTARSHKDTDVNIVRLSATGDTLWTWLGGTEGQNPVDDILLLADGGCVALSHPGLLIRLAPNGELAWMKSIPVLSGMHSLRLNPVEGGYLITGIRHQQEGWSMMSILKVSDTGNLLWRGEYQGARTSMCVCNAAIQTPDGGYLLAGLWNGEVGIIRLDPDSHK